MKAIFGPERGNRQGLRPRNDPKKGESVVEEGGGDGKKSSQKGEKEFSLSLFLCPLLYARKGGSTSPVDRGSLAFRSNAAGELSITFPPSLTFFTPSLPLAHSPSRDPFHSPPLVPLSLLSFSSPCFLPLPSLNRQATSPASAGRPSSTPSSSGPSTPWGAPRRRRRRRSSAG